MSEKESKNIKIAVSPAGRYICFNDVLGRGAYKIVYRGYDTHQGTEVAWNSISIHRLSKFEINSIKKEINLLKELSPQCKYIINFLNAWIDEKNCNIVFITEIALSGTLYDYIKKIDKINMRVIKKWAKQILQALSFLHSKNIAHRDLKCNNIFINSNNGNIIIGDFGLATKRYSNFHTLIGTPEYMAPEMYEENYDEKVDIYAFGMSLLEMITKEIPYLECISFAQIYRKVHSGILPQGINRIKNAKVKEIILKCINKNPQERPTAEELLLYTFLKVVDTEDDSADLLIKINDLNKDNNISYDTNNIIELDIKEKIDNIEESNNSSNSSNNSEPIEIFHKNTSTGNKNSTMSNSSTMVDLMNLENISKNNNSEPIEIFQKNTNTSTGNKNSTLSNSSTTVNLINLENISKKNNSLSNLLYLNDTFDKTDKINRNLLDI